MHSTESEQQEQSQNVQQSYSAELRSWVRQAQNHLSQTFTIVKDNLVYIHLLNLFIVFLIVQTVHVHNVNKLKTDLKAFLVENEVLTKTDDDTDLLAQFMEHYGKKNVAFKQCQRNLEFKAMPRLIIY